MSWLSRRADAISNNIGKAVDAVGDAVSSAASATVNAITHPIDTAKAVGGAVADGAKAVSNGIGTALSAAESAREWAVEKTANSMGHVINGVTYAVNNPGEVAGAAWDGIKTAAVETKNFSVYAAQNPGRAGTMLLQGATDAVASTVGMVGDVVVLGCNYVVRPLVNFHASVYTTAANGVLGFVGLDGSVEGDKSFKFSDEPLLGRWDANCSGYLIKKGEQMWQAAGLETEPRNGYEKIMRNGTRAVGEIGAFVAVTVATAGTGGAAMAAARGGAYAEKGVRAAALMSRMVGAGEEATLMARTIRAAATAAGENGVLGRGVYNAATSMKTQIAGLASNPKAIAMTGGYAGMNYISADEGGKPPTETLDETAMADAAGAEIVDNINAGNAALQAQIDQYGSAAKDEGQQPDSVNSAAKPPLRLADADTGDGADNNTGDATIRPASHTTRPKADFNRASEDNGLAAIVITLIENIFNVKAKDEKGQDAFWAKAIKGFLGEQFKPAAEGTQLAAATNEGSGPDIAGTISPAKGPAAMKPAA